MEIEKEKEDDGFLCLEEEYLEDFEEDSKEEDNEKNNNGQDNGMVLNNTKFNIHGHNLEKEEVHLQHNARTSNKKVDNNGSDYLILRKNMVEIKELLERM